MWDALLGMWETTKVAKTLFHHQEVDSLKKKTDIHLSNYNRNQTLIEL